MADAVKLAALRVSPDLDASKYVAGANAVDAANEGMARSATAAGSAIGQVTPKISEAGNIVSRLSHQYVDGYGTAVRFQKGIDGLQRAIETGNIDMMQTQAILEGMHRRLGLTANAGELAANGQHQLAAAAVAVNARLALQEAAAAGASNANRMLGDSTRFAAMQQRNLVFQLNDVAVSLASGMNPIMVFMQQGSQIATIYGPEEGGVGKALSETGKMAVSMVTKFWPIAAAVGAATLAVAGLTYEVNKNSEVTVGMGDVALATWNVFAQGVYDFVKPAIDQIGAWMAQLWDFISPTLKAMGNGIVGAFDLAFRNTKTIWSMLPAALGDFTITTTNNVLRALEDMINGSIGLINDFTAGARDALGAIGIDVGDIGKVEFGKFDNPFEGAQGDFQQQMGQNRLDVIGTDYMGEAFDAISTEAQAVALARLAEETDKVGGAAKAANDNFGNFLDKVNEGQAVFEATRTPFEQLGAELSKLDLMLAEGVISWDTYARAASAAVANTASNALGSLANLSAGLSQAFEDNKALAIANAVLKGGEAIVSSYASGAALGGPILGAVFAGVAAITTAAQIAAIAGTTKDSKSLPGGGSAGAVSTPAAAPAASSAGTAMNVTLVGTSFGREQIRQLLEDIADFQSDSGSTITVSAA